MDKNNDYRLNPDPAAHRLHVEYAQPALLERLTDDGLSLSMDAESSIRHHSVRMMRRAILDNLHALLNSSHYQAGNDLSRWPLVAGSVLNFGILPLAGKCISALPLHDICQAMHQAVCRYEPRIDADTLEIDTPADPWHGGQSALKFEIRGHLWHCPRWQAFVFESRLSLENGHIELRDKG